MSCGAWTVSTLLWLVAYLVRVGFKPGAAYDAVALFLIIGWTLAASTLIGLYGARAEQERDFMTTKVISGPEFGLEELSKEEAVNLINLREGADEP